jgi:hypothetical protein
VTLRGSEVRTLATVGAFRVVLAGDRRDGQDRPLDPHRGDLRHLRDQGLVETIPATIGCRCAMWGCRAMPIFTRCCRVLRRTSRAAFHPTFTAGEV